MKSSRKQKEKSEKETRKHNKSRRKPCWVCKGHDLYADTRPATVHAAVPANTFAIYGTGEDKELTELVPGILNQLGPDSLASLRKLAESYQSMQKSEEGKDGDEDDIPELVAGENFEGESKVE